MALGWWGEDVVGKMVGEDFSFLVGLKGFSPICFFLTSSSLQKNLERF